MKFIEVCRDKLFEEENANEFIQQNCGGKAKLISKKIIKKFVRAFFKTNRVEILYYGFPHVIDCRVGGLQLDIFQLYGEGAPHKPYDTVNPFAKVSFWYVGEIAYAELLENGEIKVIPYEEFECKNTELKRRENDEFKLLYKKIRDTVLAMLPITDKYNGCWQRGARDFICGIVMLACADHLEEVTDDFYTYFYMLIDNVRKLTSDKQQLDRFLSKKRRSDMEEHPKKLIDEVIRTYGKTFDAYFVEVKRYLDMI